MPLYFAYGANMDVATMAQRCPSSHVISLARLPRHRFIINGDGYSTVMRDARMDAQGVLWNLALADVRSLDRFEEVGRGLYKKLFQPVITVAGSRQAMMYIGSDSTPGRPRPGYLENIVASAEFWLLPKPYRSYLSSWLTGNSGVNMRPNASQAMGPVPGVTARAFRPVSTVAARAVSNSIVAPPSDTALNHELA